MECRRVAAPGARCRNWWPGSFMGSRPEYIEGHALLRLPLTDLQLENARQPLALALPLKINGDSARPLGSSRLSYRSLTLMRRGATVAALCFCHRATRCHSDGSMAANSASIPLPCAGAVR